MGEIAAIWIKRDRGGAMEPVGDVELIAGRGIRGNAEQGGRRQITIISEEAWRDTLADLGDSVEPTARRANVLLRGVGLENSRGRHLRLGSSVIRVFGETRPCELMDMMRPGLRAALKPAWRGGVFGEIVDGGMIRVGDPVEWV